jgi:hypothetical protein
MLSHILHYFRYYSTKNKGPLDEFYLNSDSLLVMLSKTIAAILLALSAYIKHYSN